MGAPYLGVTEIRKSLPGIPDFRLLRPPDPLSVRKAADTCEEILTDAGDRIFVGVDLQRRLAAIALDGIPALDILHEAFHLLSLELNLTRPLRDDDGLFAARTGQKNVIGEGGLHEAPRHFHSRVLRAGDIASGPEGARQISELFNFGGHRSEIVDDEESGHLARSDRASRSITLSEARRARRSTSAGGTPALLPLPRTREGNCRRGSSPRRSRTIRARAAGR